MITVSKLIEYAKDIKVLYVEDDKSIQEEINDFLGRFFPVIDLADNGKDGLELYKSGNYDIVISDINMPKMNGIEMVHAIKEINEDQKIIITSAYNEPQYLMELIDAGVDKFVLKPFNNKKFLLVLYKICEFLHNKKQKKLLQIEIAKKTAETQTILNLIEHGIVLIDKGEVVGTNKEFLKIAGFKSLESFNLEIRHITSLFERHKGYINVNSNKELIKLLESNKNDIHKVAIMKNQKEEIYLLKYKKTEDEEKYIISFTNITGEEELVNINTKTGLPNIYAAIANIEHRLSGNATFVIDLLRIENIDKMIKWHGRDIRNYIDGNIAKVLKEEKTILDENDVFVAYYGHNKFIIACNNEMQWVVERVINKISYIAAIKVDKEAKLENRNILYKPAHITIHIEPNTDIDDTLKKVKNGFDSMSL